MSIPCSVDSIVHELKKQSVIEFDLIFIGLAVKYSSLPKPALTYVWPK